MRQTIGARGLHILALACLVGCGGTAPTTPEPAAVVDLNLNGQKSGTVSCAGGMFFVSTLTNPTSKSVHVDGLLLNLTSLSPACISHPAPIGGTVAVSDVAAGTTSEIRRVDLAGDLCTPPLGRPGCEWRARAVVNTSVGTLSDEIPFATAGIPSPAPTPTPSPTSTPGPGNNPPTVAITGGGSCYPSPNKPCSVSVEAIANDRDGDRLDYEWSGCTSGSETRSTCLVSSPQTFTARVIVRDGRGGTANASKAVDGTNRPPVAQLGVPATASSNTNVTILGNGQDPDQGFICGGQICVDARASGACAAPGLFSCTCLAGIELQLRTTTGPGSCTVTVVLQDEWNLRGSESFTFQVKAP